MFTGKLICKIYTLFILKWLIAHRGEKISKNARFFNFGIEMEVDEGRRVRVGVGVDWTKLSSVAWILIIPDPLIDIVRRRVVIICKKSG